jgi:two-component system cell cycle sensor histidine kinase/response regulator CckA
MYTDLTPVEGSVVRTLATVLVADAEKVRRTLLQIGLTRRNYRVLEARDGQRALSLARRHSGPIELLLTEVRLPRLSGLELAESLASEHPEMEVLFLVGAPDSPEAEKCFSAARGKILQKPFDLPLLLGQVDEQLRSRCARKPPARSEDSAAARPSQRAV